MSSSTDTSYETAEDEPTLVVEENRNDVLSQPGAEKSN